jgi:hypothetical protein
MFLPVRVRSRDKKPCLRFTTRRVALLVGLFDLCRTCDADEVTTGPRVEVGDSMMEGDWNMLEPELPLASGLGENDRWYDLDEEGGRWSEH